MKDADRKNAGVHVLDPLLAIRAAAAVVAAVAAVGAGAAPTGLAVWDAALVAVPVAIAVWFAPAGPWWLVTGVGVAVTVVNDHWWAAVLGAAGAVLGGAARTVAAREPGRRWVVMAGAALVACGAAHAGAAGPFGLTAAIGVTGVGALGMAGIASTSRRARRTLVRVVGVVAAVAAVATLAALAGGLAARPALAEGERLARQGLRAAQRGEMEQAAADLRAAAAAFADVSGQTSGPLMLPARLVPVVAQHRHAIGQLAADAETALTAAAAALDGLDLAALTNGAGSIDLAAVQALAAPFRDLSVAIDDLHDAVDGTRNPWLVAPLQARLRTTGAEIAARATEVGRAERIVAAAPSLLGGDGTRVYFVAFITPAERRGLGGFMGNWAELTIDNGAMSMTAFGQDEDLNRGGTDPEGRRLTGPEDFLRNYGQFGFVEPDGTTWRAPWKNVTMPPDLPMVGEVIAELYPQSGGRPIDGVIVLDTTAIAELMRLTGPVRVDGLDRPLTADNAEEFLLRDQYLIENPVRTDLLDTIASAVVNDLLGSAIPEPPRVARILGPLVPDRHLMLWSTHPDEAALFAELGADGSLAQLIGDGDLAVAVNNAAGNKIDAYLDVNVDVHEGGATITLRNTAPATGLPFYVIGNLVDLPEGTNRTRLTLYTRQPLATAEQDGARLPVSAGRELDLHATTAVIDLAAGESTTIEITWATP